MYFVVLDRYHLGDPLFLTRFARDVLAFGRPLALVHGGGEEAERVLEAQGLLREWEGGVLQTRSADERSLVERATRELNRSVAHALTDAGVPAVRIEASSRGLLRPAESGSPGGGLVPGEIGWFHALMRQRAVPVVAALVRQPGGPTEQANAGAVAGTLAGTVEEGATVVCFARGTRGALVRGGDRLAEVALEGVPDDALPDPAVVAAAVATGASVVLTGPSGLVSEGFEATRVRTSGGG